VASVTMCRRRLRRSCRAFRDQSTAATTMPSLRRTRPTHRPRRRPPGTPRPAVMEPQPCLSTAFLPSNSPRRVPRGTRSENAYGPDEEPRRSMTDQGLTGTRLPESMSR
jgi:hypothetical protein